MAQRSPWRLGPGGAQPCPRAGRSPPRRSIRFYAMRAMRHSPMASHCAKAKAVSRHCSGGSTSTEARRALPAAEREALHSALQFQDAPADDVPNDTDTARPGSWRAEGLMRL
ncbi:uncharacterized protein SETTUDRAFT_162525 [Exserohilum turcica Et28A]|uniref:Uncharacterized protein n=1 Tax=Exserohilum turcicum (strain 28A) TaxID=671987 RepID=R0KSN2_EXST2|nr:uncharacterized protein SETTUDRAFT_162525 [Exserohilum turcica Et28A]EOA91979.1 hypothetical protein SETTUDRAFT_162525 [Exserohilum turcica Et28A]